MSLQIARKVINHFHVKTPAADIETLSARELEILRLLAKGHRYKEIADQLGISAKSVETYRARLVRKTGHKSKVALTKFAAANDIIVV